MEKMTSILMAVFSIMCLWLGSNVVEGKCSGEWASHHACRGANGKRADPSTEIRNSPSRESVLFDRLFRSSVSPSSEYDDDNMSGPDGQENAMYEVSTDYKDRYITKLEGILQKMIANLRNRSRQ